MRISEGFLLYLRGDGPKFGDRSDFPINFELWNEEDLDTFNTEYEVWKYIPGFYGFGSDGGGEMLAFGPEGKIYAVPFIGMEAKAATLIANSWEEFQATWIESDN